MKKDGKDPRFRFQLGRALFKMAMLVPEFGPKVRGGRWACVGDVVPV